MVDIYRESPEDSYSTIKDFIFDRKKYHKKYILKQPVEEKESDDVIRGTLVHILLGEPDSIEDLFQIAMNNKPTGQMLLFVEALYKKTLDATSMNGTVTRSMSTLMDDAFNEVKFDRDGNEVAFKKKDLSYVIERFEGTNAEEYYNELRTSSAKYIINSSDLENATRIVEGLKTSFNTSHIINAQSTNDVEVLWETEIYFEINGHPFKGKIDLMIIDHKRKIIKIYDLKITWMVEKFSKAFRENKYYLQVGSYMNAVKQYAKDREMEDYIIEPLRFITADSINYLNPLVYTTSSQQYECGMHGYIDLFGEYHPGILKALDDIAWHKENDIWNISRDNYINGGEVLLKELV